MSMQKKSFAMGIAGLILASASTLGRGAVVEPCETNFTVKEGLFNKKIYKTWQEYQDFPFHTIYRRVYKSLIKDGWIINITDKEGGLISASQLEGSPEEGGKVASLNIFIEATNTKGSLLGSVKVSMIFSVPGGLHAHEDMVRKNLCAIMYDIK